MYGPRWSDSLLVRLGGERASRRTATMNDYAAKAAEVWALVAVVRGIVDDGDEY